MSKTQTYNRFTYTPILICFGVVLGLGIHFGVLVDEGVVEAGSVVVSAGGSGFDVELESIGGFAALSVGFGLTGLGLNVGYGFGSGVGSGLVCGF